MLSGKNKEQFLLWYVNEYMSSNIPRHYFLNLPPEMQKGVYEKYFDSLGYKLDTESYYDMQGTFRVSFTYNGDLWGCQSKDRITAFTEAVKQLDKLINDEL